MKNITTYIYKLTIVATSLVMVYFVSAISTIAQANELLKAEPVKQIHLLEQAKSNLALSFSTLQVTPSIDENNIKTAMVNETDSANKSKSVALNNTLVIGE